MAEKLKSYRDKRNFGRTAEPAGGEAAAQSESLYVMHKHAASHDHFDLRLEEGGVLRSWALPKGPSLEPGEKRLAVEVEDHPLEYGQFEGVIPKGEYGGGTSMLWDQGLWQPRGKRKQDKLDFELQGQKLSGHWTLVKMHGKANSRGKDNNWLLIKRSDGDQPKLEPDDLSVVSGRSMEEIAREEAPDDAQAKGGDKREPRAQGKTQTKPASSNKAVSNNKTGSNKKNPASSKNDSVPTPDSLEKAQKKAMPELIAPQLATLVDDPPEGESWLHEIKFDGYRLIARLAEGKVTLLTRNGKDWTHRFSKLADVLSHLPVDNAILDGEVASFDQDGASNFRKLQDILGDKKRPGRADQLVYQVFDLLYLDGYDLRSTPLIDRKKALVPILKSLANAGDIVRYSDHMVGQGEAFFEQVSQLGLEGMVSKKASATYRSGRQKSWLKTKSTRQDEFVVGGFSRPSGARQGFGALLLGTYDDSDPSRANFVYVGRVGSGFSASQLTTLHQQLKKRTVSDSPFANDVPDAAGVKWVKPEMVVDIEFTEKTQSGALRHPVYRGLREDKDPLEVVMNADIAKRDNTEGQTEPARPAKTGSTKDPFVAGVQLTHADRILYPEQGITKLDLGTYYEAVQDWILPHLVKRPLSLMRCPEGWEEECFFQKHPGATFAKQLPRVPIKEKRGTSDFVYVESVKDLVTLAQFGVLELHPWGSLVSDVEAPDTLVFDLDPGPELSWQKIAQGATGIRERLNELGLNGFLQATGGKGLHIIVPIKPGTGWDELKAFAHAVAQAHAQDEPDAFTTNMAKSKRSGKVFIDYLRNGRGATSIARYSVRAREGAPIATPMRWDELSPSANANRYTINNIRRRLTALKEDPWEGYEQARVKISKRMLQQVGLK